jgi:ABC-2 type transport system permease protein
MNKYFDFLKTNLSNEISHIFSYKQTLIFEIISIFLALFSQIVVIFFIYNITNGFPGWNIYEMIFLIGTNGLAFSISGFTSISMFFQNSWKIEYGHFHNVLLKPFNTQGFMIISSINDSSWLIELFGNIILIIYSLIMINPQLTLWGVISYILLILISCLCFYGIMGVFMNFVFSYPRARNVIELFWTMGNFSNYPLGIFPDWIKLFLTFIMPMALAGFYPASYFLGKMSNYIYLALFLFIGLIFAFIGVIAIKEGIKKHTSYGG